MKLTPLYSLLTIALFASCQYPEPAQPTEPEPEEVSLITWDTCSQNIGDHVCDFILVNQFDEDFTLYDHVEKFIVLDFSAAWCGPCQRAAAEIQETQDKYESDGLLYLTVLIENLDREPPTQEDVEDWADYFGIVTSPVLGGSRDMLGLPDEGWPLTGWPTFYFVDDKMVLQDSQRGWSSELLDNLIRDHLGLKDE